MVDILPRKDIPDLPSGKDLLYDGEIVVIVDDSPEIVLLLESYLTKQDIPVAKARNGEELYAVFEREKVALILLDIGLPGKSGTEILSELVPHNPDLGIIMVTGSTDIQTALDCLRKGADDYLTKPVIPKDFNRTLQQTLKKRRLAIENRLFQRELEISSFRMQFLHTLNLKMNTAYLNVLELDRILQTILAGITSEDGLKFNRAFLALYDDSGTTLSGKLAIGPSTKEEAGYLWQDIKSKNLGLHDILSGIAEQSVNLDSEVNRIAKALHVSASESNHILIYATEKRQSILVRNGIAEHVYIPQDFLELLNERNFVVVPLFSPSESLGVIIADNFVTGAPITDADVTALEIFANQASLAIKHSHLYRSMNSKIQELERMTAELEKNKDMLIEAERYSTIGYISAQLVHAIRNPLTSIGGTARLLLRRTGEENTKKFLKIMAEETTKIEETLKNLFQFVEDIALTKRPHSIAAALEDSLTLFYRAFQKNNIELELDLRAKDVMLEIDEKMMRKVFMHLIRNSIEAMEGGGRLRVELFHEKGGITINIIDSGTGMRTNPEVASNPFYTTKTYGTGLGLTLVEQIVELHDAEFSLQQLSPQGMQASLHFPGDTASQHS
ncbi:MAG: response regulator, partial [Desulfopila sp.]|jgi:signal transduction histidine kinase/DNA-binding response OmpR family regulator|nr:response regulator [Desulfopila sp.]